MLPTTHYLEVGVLVLPTNWLAAKSWNMISEAVVGVELSNAMDQVLRVGKRGGDAHLSASSLGSPVSSQPIVVAPRAPGEAFAPLHFPIEERIQVRADVNLRNGSKRI